MFIKKFTFNAFQENTYVVYSHSGSCVIIDPGCYSNQEESELITFIQEKELKPLALLNTHAHIDHVLGNAFVLNRFSIPYYLHDDDVKTLNSVVSYAHLYGFEGYKVSPQPTQSLSNIEKLKFDDIEFTIFHTPGHCPGHVVLYSEKDQFVINGDVLFDGSFGRVDLPGGDIEILKKTIFNTMFHLPESTIVYCGHGPETTIGKEKLTNYIHNF
jgi:glyoxylase-like metal-dependent hydrolase (beta-lactamase superfamily II)